MPVIIGSILSDLFKDTFGIGGEGAVIIQVLLIAVVAGMGGYIAEAANNGRLSALVKSLAILICVGLAIKTAWDTFSLLVNGPS